MENLTKKLLSFIKFGALYATLLMVLGSCSTTNFASRTATPYNSFVFLRGDSEALFITVCDETSCTIIKDSDGYHINASGFVVANSKRKGVQYVMTAAHFCAATDALDTQIREFYANKGLLVTQIQHEFIIMINDEFGESHVATTVGIDRPHDICVVAITDADLPTVRLGEPLTRGQKIYNIAAPLGSWAPGVTHRFDGYNSGIVECDSDRVVGSIRSFCNTTEVNWSALTLAATFGSSGSPVFDLNNNVVGMVVAVMKEFPNVVWATTITDMRKFLDEVIKADSAPASR